MRVGRIILALLAPLVSVPAVAGHVQDSLQSQTPAVDSLLQFLRSVVPVVSAAAESEVQTSVHAIHVEWPDLASFDIPAPFSPAHEATLRLVIRQQYRSLLRC